MSDQIVPSMRAAVRRHTGEQALEAFVSAADRLEARRAVEGFQGSPGTEMFQERLLGWREQAGQVVER
jgi:hypothetical protein